MLTFVSLSIYAQNFNPFQKNPFSLDNSTEGSNASNSTPAFVDLDGDGDLDIMSGGQYGDFYYFQNTSLTGVFKASKYQMRVIIFPNPATNSTFTIFLSLQTTEIVSLTLYNALGQIINNQILKDANGNVKTEMNVSLIPTGFYFLTVKGQGWARNEKVMINGQ